jgi:hypothetical protein
MRSLSLHLVRPSIRPHPIRALAAEDRAGQSDWAEDAKLFVTGWLAGLVFFGTLLA